MTDRDRLTALADDAQHAAERAATNGKGDVDRLAALRKVTVGADALDVAEALQEWVKALPADALKRTAERERAVKLLTQEKKVTGARDMVNAALPPRGNRDGQEQGQAVTLTDPEPWPDPVDGARLLAELTRTFSRFSALPEHGATALALWTLHAHAHDAAAVSPFLGLSSPERRCGKTTTLKVIGALVPRSLPAANVSPSALFRGVEKYRPSLLLDEADTVFRENEELRSILNAAHDRASAWTMRSVGDAHETRLFSTWCPKAIALIGALPPTIADRSIVLHMRRRRADEQVERLRVDRLRSELDPLRRQAWTWAQAHLDSLRAADPDVPKDLHDRAADNWRPLLAIADLAGGRWPARAREAALRFSGGDGADEDTPGELLLADLRVLFHPEHEDGTPRDPVDRITTADVLDYLHRLDTRPWGEWKRGKPLSPTQLARLLKRYGVRPCKWKDGAVTLRGYARADFADAWGRYLPSPSPEGGPDSPPPPPPSGATTYAAPQPATGGVTSAQPATAELQAAQQVGGAGGGVAGQNPPPGRGKGSSDPTYALAQRMGCHVYVRALDLLAEHPELDALDSDAFQKRLRALLGPHERRDDLWAAFQRELAQVRKAWAERKAAALGAAETTTAPHADGGPIEAVTVEVDGDLKPETGTPGPDLSLIEELRDVLQGMAHEGLTRQRILDRYPGREREVSAALDIIEAEGAG